MPEISVVVPVYNVADYLDKCISSILAQTWKDFEVILVDDGSTDRSGEILDSWKERDARIHVIHKKNGGLSDARNEGMKRAEGTYVSFIDSDDFIEPIMLETCMKKLHETNADMVIFDFYQYYQASGRKEIIKSGPDDADVCSLKEDPRLLTSIANAAWNKIYRLSLFRDHDITYPWGCLYEDLGTTYRLIARASRVAFVHEPLYDYLKDRPGNITGEFNMRAYHVLDMVKITLDDFKRLGIYETYYEELKFLGGVNILECLKKTRECTDRKLVNEYIDVCFMDIRNNWPEFPKCRYKIAREKNDWIYTDPIRLKAYLALRGRRK